MVSGVIQVEREREMEVHPRQRDHHVKRHRGAWEHGTFKGMAISSIRGENGRQDGQGSSGREIWLSPITKDFKSWAKLDFTKKAMGSPKSAL